MRLSTTRSAMTALTMPAPDMAGITGWKTAATKSMTTSAGLGFLPSAATSPSCAPLALRSPRRGSTSAKTSATCGPMTIWYWPLPWTTLRTPSMEATASSETMASSLRWKRRRVAQCVAWVTLFLPPTASTMLLASSA